MTFIITIIGRSNVGKSTLFNYLLCKKKSLVNNSENLTRDRNYGYIKIKNKKFLIIDTGGIDDFKNEIQIKVAAQTFLSIKNSHVILFLVNAYDGLLHNDKVFNKYIYEYKYKIFLVANKIDKLNYEVINLDFYSLGLTKEIYPISAYNGYGVNFLFEKICHFLETQKKKVFLNNINIKNKYPIKIAIIGKSNVGKSTLINYILNEERMIVHNLPGTTVDFIYIPIIYKNIKYIIIDTPGILNIKNDIYNLTKILKIIKKSDIILFLIDINYSISNQDLLLINFIIKNSRSLVIVFNKLDKISKFNYIKIKNVIKNRLKFIKNIFIKFISGLHGIGINNLFKSIEYTYYSSKKKISTSLLNKIMNDAIIKHQPPLFKGRFIKLKYAHLGGHDPFTIIIHGNKVKNISNLYKKYLINYFKKSFNILGTQIFLKFKENNNPYLK
ncbi:ribosome biogenesis GTPase Der [Enterobacteriaceae bacterium ET-AT1-13]|nr:ribosome biogenesis GTPase Der [Enterobacteriaceae bacterium ET-AT1-13]WGS66491.1 ribosome biogenesis GTPase Der [Enterobacteriaceae bacterium Cmel17]WMC17515.1 MAG: ribosome biogenesis GTPase Der [Enterobacteriaceae bacterium Cmel21]WMC17722.1 MAG: ribosome biogenesis GTPase Der [Enterobacteriaceae bacterium PSmelAO3-2]WMC17926.1 MAG: ribosome biogenesis GTPase Der [Enterobacteriaceae bacterium PSmelAO3-1]WMC18129.1 MAG: ribosome biogenesis GTPase Der [Enterobacteriaceae bacterium PSmelAO1